MIERPVKRTKPRAKKRKTCVICGAPVRPPRLIYCSKVHANVGADRNKAEKKQRSTARRRRTQKQGLTPLEYLRSGRLKIPDGPRMGQPFRLLDYQDDYLEDAYTAASGFAVLCCGRGGGKTTLIAGVCVAELDTLPQRKTVVVAGVDEVIAEKLWGRVEWMAQDRGITLHRVKNETTHAGTQSKLIILTGGSSAGLADAPDLIVLDELAYWRPNSGPRFAAIESSSRKKNCLILALSTRGDPASAGNHLQEIIEAEDGIIHLYEADAEKAAKDPFDEARLWEANPGLAHGLPDRDGLDKAIASARRRSSALDAFLEFHLNLPRIKGPQGHRLVEQDEFVRCLAAELPPAAAGVMIVGVDLGETLSLSGVVGCCPLSGRTEVRGFFPEGLSLAERGRKDRVGDLYERAHEAGEIEFAGQDSLDEKVLIGWVSSLWANAYVVGDPYRSTALRSACANAGLPFEERRVGFLSSGPDIMDTQALVAEGFFQVAPGRLVLAAMGQARTIFNESRLQKLSRRTTTSYSRNDVAQAWVLMAGAVMRWRRANEDLVAAYEAGQPNRPPSRDELFDGDGAGDDGLFVSPDEQAEHDDDFKLFDD